MKVIVPNMFRDRFYYDPFLGLQYKYQTFEVWKPLKSIGGWF